MSNEEKLIVVFTGNHAKAGLIKSVLENEGVAAFLLDAITGSMASIYTGSGIYQSVKVAVRNKDLAKAEELIQQIEN